MLWLFSLSKLFCSFAELTKVYSFAGWTKIIFKMFTKEFSLMSNTNGHRSGYLARTLKYIFVVSINNTLTTQCRKTIFIVQIYERASGGVVSTLDSNAGEPGSSPGRDKDIFSRMRRPITWGW
jgi:hypothetical protein